jgi:arylsulfatase A-like enzyme
MDRRKFLALLPAGMAAQQSLATAPASSRSGRPNFLFLIADDLTYRSIRSRNNPEVHTPNLDRLAASGCTFTHAFHQGSWSGAVCVPSRTMLNSGLTGFRAQEHADEVPTWGQTLGVAGYDTYICGKWHLGLPMLGRSFHEMGPIGPAMFASTPVSGEAYDRPSPGNTWQPDDKSLHGHWLSAGLWRNAVPDTIEHSCSIYAETAADFLKNKLAHRSDPFFMYIGFNSPHDPRQSPKEYLDLYPQDQIQIPPNYLPEHPFDQGDAHVRDERLAPFPRTREAVQLHRREYYALITYMDAQIGKILAALEQSGRADNTYVILTADHGLAVGEHGLMGKQNLYDCSTRMPLLISGPGVPSGRIVDELVYQHSMYATTCELAGVPVPSTVEFPSLVPLLHGNKTLHDAVFCYYIGYQRSVRTTRHKLIVYPKAHQVQLFDLAEDPWETKNLADAPALADVKRDLWARLRSFQKELGDPLVLEEI